MRGWEARLRRHPYSLFSSSACRQQSLPKQALFGTQPGPSQRRCKCRSLHRNEALSRSHTCENAGIHQGARAANVVGKQASACRKSKAESALLYRLQPEPAAADEEQVWQW